MKEIMNDGDDFVDWRREINPRKEGLKENSL